MTTNGVESDDKYTFLEYYEKLKLALWALVIFVLYLCLTYFFPLPDSETQQPIRPWLFFEPKGGFLEARAALGGALISFSAFGAIMQLLRFKSMDREVASAMRDVFSESVTLIEGFNNVQKRNFVKNSLEALLGKGIGPSTYNYIKPMLDDGAGFRTKYEYKVWVMDTPNGTIPNKYSERFSAKDYRWIRENLSYKLLKPTKSIKTEDYSKGPFTILFLFDKTSLELTNPDQEVYARFLIELNENELDWLFKLPPEDAVEFFEQTFQPQLDEDPDAAPRMPVQFDTKLVKALDDESGRCRPHFKVTMKQPLEAKAGESKLNLRFIYPYRRSATHFIFTLPQPVYSPTLSFNFPPNGFKPPASSRSASANLSLIFSPEL
jgi:hypothetical protein